jgi:hypothetical protein
MALVDVSAVSAEADPFLNSPFRLCVRFSIRLVDDLDWRGLRRVSHSSQSIQTELSGWLNFLSAFPTGSSFTIPE